MERETAEAYVLGGIGLAKGVLAEYVQPHLNSKRAWLAMGIGIIAYEFTAPDGELLSEGCDRAIERHKLLTVGAIGYTAAHLSNVLPERYDAFHRIFG